MPDPNDLTGRPEEEESDETYEEFNRRYFAASLVEGAFPLCEIGCALRIWLVVSGPEAGHLWYDWRADDGGLVPVSTETSARVTFLEWYRDWLAEVERAAADVPGSTSRVISVTPGAAAAEGEAEAGLFARLRRWLGGTAR